MLCIKHAEQFLFPLVCLKACTWHSWLSWQSCFFVLEFWWFVGCTQYVEYLLFPMCWLLPQYSFEHVLSWVLWNLSYWCCINKVEQLLFSLGCLHTLCYFVYTPACVFAKFSSYCLIDVDQFLFPMLWVQWTSYVSKWDGHHCLLKISWSFCVSTFGGCSKELLAYWPCICITFDIFVLS